jgi:excinuclease ABC subunit A
VEPGLCSVCEGRGLVEAEVCESCQGSGYDKNVLAYRFGGIDIFQLGQLPLHQLEDFLTKNCSEDSRIPDSLLMPIFDRLQLLTRLDLDYLKLDRRANTLSDGELQLLQIASFMHSSLTFVTYILDEPTQGLTPKELPKLLWLLEQLKNNGNSVLIVEHNPFFLNFVDYIIELGPGAGEKGGTVIHSGSLEKLLQNPDSTTAVWLQKFRDFSAQSSNSSENSPPGKNLNQLEFGFSKLNYRIFKNFRLKLPFNQWTVVTGPVGSGKTTLLQEILAPLFSGDFQVKAPVCQQVFGREYFPGGMSCVDFKSTTSHPHSHIASYLGVWKYLRDLFASVSLAKIRGYKSSRFSVSKKGGRCEKCKGTGVNIIELGLLSEVELPCEKCKGTGYNSETREIMYRGYSIDRVLNFSVDRAAEFFSFSRKISRKLALLQQTGLGYLRKYNDLSFAGIWPKSGRTPAFICLMNRPAVFISKIFFIWLNCSNAWSWRVIR